MKALYISDLDGTLLRSDRRISAESCKILNLLIGCDRLVVFGDVKNDIPMFKAADECYAVENA